MARNSNALHDGISLGRSTMLRLIGMLDSPYVRRVAVALHMLELPFAHEPLSVFRDFEAFGSVNPVVKAPSLVTDEGSVLMDSTLILDFLDRLVPPQRRIAPDTPAAFAKVQRVNGLALAACEKTVQIVYELNLRPPEKRHEPWLDRVKGQLEQAYRLLEAEIPTDGWIVAQRPMSADITAAVAWDFSRSILEHGPVPNLHPNLNRLSQRAEALAAFLAVPPSTSG